MIVTSVHHTEMHRYVCAGGRCPSCYLLSTKTICKRAFFSRFRDGIITSKTAYEKQYQVFRKLLKVCYKEITLSEIMDYIDKIIIYPNKNITVQWVIDL